MLSWLLPHFQFYEVKYPTKNLNLELRGQLPLTLKQGLNNPSITKANPPTNIAPSIT